MIKFLINAFFQLILALNMHSIYAQNSVEFRSIAFFPVSDRLSNIYGDVIADYQIEVASSFYKDFDGWSNLDWFSKSGKSEDFHSPTKISIINFSLGIKYSYTFYNKFKAYVGIGPSMARIWLKNKCECSHRTINKSTFGGVLKSGVNYSITKNLFFDLFLDYLYQPSNFKTKVDLGGFKTGAGIGLHF